MIDQGLTQAEVLERKKKGLANDIPEKVSRSYKEIIIGNTLTWFNMILFILGAILVILGKPLDAVFATGILVLNILIATIQECKAKRRLDAIALLIRPTVRAMRDGKETVIQKTDIVIDDIILVGPGDQILVDGELFDAQYLEIDESVMTGESSTVKKRPGDKVLSGSFCIAGEGRYKVTAVGENTVAYKMMDNVKKTSNKNTPMQKELQSLIKIMIILGLVLFVLMEIVRALTGDFNGQSIEDIAEIMTVDAVLALDVVPLALFLTIIISYMVAAIRMADSGVLLQRSNSVESMSHVDTVCMDKTGTITTQKLLFESMRAYVSIEDAKKIITAFANSTGSRNRTVEALIEHYGEHPYKATEEIRFSSERKFSAVKVEIDGKTTTIFTGAITSFGDRFKTTDLDSDVNNYSKLGLRTLVITTGPEDANLLDDNFTLPELKLVAVVAIRDELRPDCKETISKFIDAGMDIKVISGDDPVMVDALFSIANIPGKRRIISGPELEMMEGQEKIDAVLQSNIFGRMKPEQKEDVIRTLKENGRYVAMVGDGVNDVRSLKEANVGISLESGTGAAKGVSDMVLLKDKFSALPVALVEGKRTVCGMSDLLKTYVSRNFTLGVLMLVVCVFLGWWMGVRPFELRACAVYGFICVSIPTILLIIWAQPEEEHKNGILPTVLTYAIPMAILVGLMGSALFVGFQFAASEGWIKVLMEEAVSGEGVIVNGQGALLMFLLLTGIIQIFFVCPYNKFTSVNGYVRHDIKPVIMCLVLFAIVVALYALNEYSLSHDDFYWFHELLPIVPVPLKLIPIVIAAVIIWFFVARYMLRAKMLGGISHWLEKGFEKQSVKLDKVEAKSEARKDEFWDKVNNMNMGGKNRGNDKD